MSRDVVIFGRYWKATTFSSIVQPTIYLLAFGLGFGALVARVGHVSYVEYVATGVVATAVLFSSAFPGMFNTFVRWQFQRTYDAMLAAPVDVEELITAEVLWISLRAGRVRPRAAARRHRVRPGAGAGDAAGAADRLRHRLRLRRASACSIAAVAKTIDNFNYVTSAVLTPMFLVAGTFFPISTLPRRRAHDRAVQPALPLRAARARRLAGQPRPGRPRATPAVLLAFALLMWRLAIWQLGRRLID